MKKDYLWEEGDQDYVIWMGEDGSLVLWFVNCYQKIKIKNKTLEIALDIVPFPSFSLFP